MERRIGDHRLSEGTDPRRTRRDLLLRGDLDRHRHSSQQEGSPYPTGNAPYNIYAADFNGDERPDLATSNGDAQNVSVFLRQPGGGFAAEAGSPFTLPGATSNGTVGDFNGDGRPDLAISDIQGTGVVIALRNPAGGFTQEANVSLGGQLGAVGAGDFNQDGKLDIAVANYGSANVSVLLRNSANNGFTLAPNGNYAVGAQPRQIAIADFNGDLRPDIARHQRRLRQRLGPAQHRRRHLLDGAGRSRSARSRTGSPPGTSTATGAPTSRLRIRVTTPSPSCCVRLSEGSRRRPDLRSPSAMARSTSPAATSTATARSTSRSRTPAARST